MIQSSGRRPLTLDCFRTRREQIGSGFSGHNYRVLSRCEVLKIGTWWGRTRRKAALLPSLRIDIAFLRSYRLPQTLHRGNWFLLSFMGSLDVVFERGSIWISFIAYMTIIVTFSFVDTLDVDFEVAILQISFIA